MGITTRATVRESNQQNNTISTGNTREGYFSYFNTIEVNLFRGFRTFGESNNNNLPSGNNNNNNSLSSFPLLRFEKGLEKGFNSLLSGENVRRLDPNVAALVNALIEANLRINYPVGILRVISKSCN